MALLTTRPHAVESAPRVTVEANFRITRADRSRDMSSAVSVQPPPPPRAPDASAPPPRRRPNRAVEEIDRAFAIVKEELGTLIQTSTPTTKAIAYVLVVSYLVNLVLPFSATYLALVPEKTIPCVWNVFTSGFYEMNVFGLAVDAVGVMYLGRLLEPIWGTREFVNFVVVVQTCVGVAAFVTMYILYVATASQFYLFAKFSGFHGVLAALTVALRQQLPEERVPLPAPLGALLKMRNKHLPGAYCVATAALSIASGAKHHHVGLWPSPVGASRDGFPAVLSVRFVDTSAGGGGVDVVVRGDDGEEFGSPRSSRGVRAGVARGPAFVTRCVAGSSLA